MFPPCPSYQLDLSRSTLVSGVMGSASVADRSAAIFCEHPPKANGTSQTSTAFPLALMIVKTRDCVASTIAAASRRRSSSVTFDEGCTSCSEGEWCDERTRRMAGSCGIVLPSRLLMMSACRKVRCWRRLFLGGVEQGNQQSYAM